MLPFGRLSMRKLFVSVAAILMAFFACIIVPTSSVSAQAVTAEWRGASIMYDQHQYTTIADAQAGNSTNLPTGSKIYAYVEPSTAGPSKAHLIYFAPGTDPATAKQANLAVYDYIPPAGYSNPTAAATISINPQTADNTGTTSCDSTFTAGVGWIVCPVTKFLAGAMDWLFNILSGFLTVRPVQSDQETPLYRAWSFSRNFANIMFVIGFLVIIYSQLTSIGLTNYNIKKMLPRLIVAAILVNVSYWICSIAIDVSNILGYSIQDVFIAIRNSLVGTEGNSWSISSFQSVTSFILSGGTAALGAGFAAHALLAGTVGGALYLLLPILVGVLVSVVVALLVMAARQALITILVILSPLAFVAYLLPNTEKYFEKWRELLTTMLIMFPLFSVIFGGSQLAGAVIIQNADSINMIILGMAVQVAPIIVTPMLIKFSGSLLGKIAGIVNNPSKGLVDRTRNWSKERAEQHKARAMGKLAERDANGLPRRRRDGLARASRRIEMNKRSREGRLQANQSWIDADWANQSRAHDVHAAMERSNLQKATGEALGQAKFEVEKTANAHLQKLEFDARAAKLKVDLSKMKVEANWDEYRAGDVSGVITPAGLSTSALANFISGRQQLANAVHADATELETQTGRQRSAKEAFSERYTSELFADTAMQQRSGGIAKNGAIKAQARATAELYRQQAEAVKFIAEASPVKAGDIDGMAAQFTEAVRTHNAEAARAYTDMLATSGNPGVSKLRQVLAANESLMNPEVTTALKEHINSSQTINVAAEDIAQWSRDIASRSVTDVSQDTATWSSMAPAAFAQMKKSSQLIALGIPGAISRKTAQAILDNPAAGNLKPDVLEAVKLLANS